MTTKKKIMILDNSGILFVFGFLVYWKSGHVKVVKKKKCDIEDNNFLGFITINNISIPFFNWKIAAILFVSVVDYY